MGFIKEFTDFAVKGNALDLAVGVIIGAAFGKIVDSLVNDIIMPLIGLVTGGGVDFTNRFLVFNGQHYDTVKAAKDAGVPVLAYGSFVTVVLNFLIVAFAIFIVVRQINRLRGPKT